MAKNAVGRGMPVDTAEQLAPGVSYRESAFFADEGQRGMGFYAGFGGDTAIGESKGNRAPTSLPPSLALTGPGPFVNLRGGTH